MASVTDSVDFKVKKKDQPEDDSIKNVETMVPK